MSNEAYDLIVIGSGPAGLNAAIQGSKAGKRVAMIERERNVGGACVHWGTIPSKTLRENAVQMNRIRAHAESFDLKLKEGIEMGTLMNRMHAVIKAHDRYMAKQLARFDVDMLHGRGSFLGGGEILVHRVDGSESTLKTTNVVVATGSRPRRPNDVPVDHENILDSDSILSMIYLPSSMTVLGAGVIACEYAAMFASLGVAVTMIDRGDRPLRFIDPELTERFVAHFEKSGGRFIASTQFEKVEFDGLSSVVTTLPGGERIVTDKMLVALGRVANLDSLRIENVGLVATDRGVLTVDEFCMTSEPGIYAAGDVVGPPGLASASMEQGRRAVCHMFGMDPGAQANTIPAGIFTIPEMSIVGLSEAEAREKHGDVVVGRADFGEVARGQISGVQEGLMKIVADVEGNVLGVHIFGEGATELIHIGQLSLLHGATLRNMVETIYNFPTLGEAYRVAALDGLFNLQSLQTDKAA